MWKACRHTHQNLFAEFFLTVQRSSLAGRSVPAVPLDSPKTHSGKSRTLVSFWKNEQCWDHVNGGFLDLELTEEARRRKLDVVNKETVYSYDPPIHPEGERSQRNTAGLGGHQERRQAETQCSSRMCGQHCKRGAHAAVSLSPENLFNAMPQLLMSLKTPRSASKDGHVLLIAHFDISRTHFIPRAQREVFVMEDPAKGQSKCGALGEVHVWNTGRRQLVAWRSTGMLQATPNPAVLFCIQMDARMLVLGDDCVARRCHSCHWLARAVEHPALG